MKTVHWWIVAAVEAALIVALTIALVSEPTPADAEPEPVVDAGNPEGATEADDPSEAATREARRTASTAPTERSAVDSVPARPSDGRVAWTGRVIDDTGEQVERVYLTLFRDDAVPTKQVGRSSIGPYDAGWFVFPGLEPGAYVVHVRAEGLPDTNRTLEVPAGSTVFHHDLRIARAWELRVAFVTPAGRAIREELVALAETADEHDRRRLLGVEVEPLATLAPPPAALPTTDSRSSPLGLGKWRSAHGWDGLDNPMPAPWAGVLELPARQDLFVSAVARIAVLSTQAVTPDLDEVQLEVDLDAVLAALCTVHLRVVGADQGDPIRGAGVSVTDAQSGGLGTPTDDDGRVTLRYLRPGTHDLDVRSEGKFFLAQIQLEPGQVLDLGELPLADPVRVAFHTVDVPSDSQLRCTVTPLGTGLHPAFRPARDAFTERDGDQLTVRVPAGRYRLTARADGLTAETEFDTGALSETAIPLRFEPQAKLSVTPPESDTPFELTLTDAAGRTRYSRWIHWSTPFDLDLPAGPYTVRTTGLDGGSATREITLPAEGAMLDLR